MSYTSPSEINLTANPSGLFVWINDVTNYWFSNSLLMVIWVIIVMGYLVANKDDYAGATAVSSYIVTVLATLMWIINLASGWAVSIALGTSLLFTAWLMADRRGTA